ncbi:dienelactone hydrolase family protein [Gallaecimonas mangrovi]|uniref:dienelactone hydrolase family protein n=1 Tax=Gallaecimonas mangrovi TaxID=2291597 RepID=UPI000E1FB5B3|nr:dienelactone hydrolase family protein [Gallaecimonas mangrovi]
MEQRPIPQEAFDWYDEYAHGLIDRRTFIQRLTGLAALGFSLATLTSALLPNYANAEQVSFNDPAIKANYLKFDSPKGYGEGQGYLAAPVQTDEKPLPAVLVVHENRGLNPYIKDVARRLAKAGYLAFAPDALYPLGGYPGNDDDGRAMQASMDKGKMEEDFIAAALMLKSHPRSNGKLGAVGFCFGGYIVNMLAASLAPPLAAAVPFYGTPAAEPLRHNVKGPLMLHFAGLDKRVDATWPAYEQALKQNGAQYQAFFYENTNHGFHNDSTARYTPEAAELAWSRTLAFFAKQLG